MNYHLSDRRTTKAAQLLPAITVAIEKSPDFHTALGETLRQVCEVTGWNYGEAWIKSLDGTSLEYSSVWDDSSSSLEPFRKLSQTLTFPKNIGLPGRVWLSKQPEWIGDVSQARDSIFLRWQAALDCGLKAGLAIPVLAEDYVLAVLVFFMFPSSKPNNQLIEIVYSMTTELGEIFEQKRVQQVLKTQYRILETQAEGITVCNEQGNIFFTNRAFDSMFGYPPSALIGKNISILNTCSPERSDLIISKIAQNLAPQGSWVGELKYLRQNGTLLIAEVRVTDWEIAERKYWIWFFSDITLRRQAERELPKSQQRIAALIELLPGVAFSCANDSNWSMKYLSDGCLELTGYQSEELLCEGICYDKITHPQDLPKVLLAIENAVLNRENYQIEYRIYHKLGQEKWVWEKGRGVFDDAGKLIGIEGIIIDITEQKQAEAALIEERNFVSGILDTAGALVIVLDSQGLIVRLNRAGEEITGYTLDQVKGRYFWEMFLIPQEMDRIKADFQALKLTGLPNSYETYWLNNKGNQRLIAWSNRALFNPDRSIKYIIYTGIDITAHQQAEEALRQAERKYRSIFENAVVGIFQTSLEGKYLIANPMLARIYGYDSPDELLLALTDIERQLYITPNRRNEFMRLIQEEGAIWGFESQIYRKDGSVIWISENAYGLYDASGNLLGYEGTVVDITEQKRAEAIIQYQAFHDLLTSLPNRVLFNENLVLSLKNAPETKNKLAVMFLDLDRFKIINDTLGHAMGDRLLKSVAERLRNCLREGDIVARWGGDEFTVLLSQINSPEDAGKIAQRIIEALKLPFDLDIEEIHTSTSIGIALYPEHGEDVNTLLKNADHALYKAKELGRNNYQFYMAANYSEVAVHEIISIKVKG